MRGFSKHVNQISFSRAPDFQVNFQVKLQIVELHFYTWEHFFGLEPTTWRWMNTDDFPKFSIIGEFLGEPVNHILIFQGVKSLRNPKTQTLSV